MHGRLPPAEHGPLMTIPRYVVGEEGGGQPRDAAVAAVGQAGEEQSALDELPAANTRAPRLTQATMCVFVRVCVCFCVYVCVRARWADPSSVAGALEGLFALGAYIVPSSSLSPSSFSVT